jgi:glycerol-3-phosphate acyltransferase PlsY
VIVGAYLVFGTLPVALVSYLLGCFNGSILVSKYILHNDIRNHGSGNAGLTNFYRVFGGGLTFVVILSDVLKAVLAVSFGAALFRGTGDPLAGKYLAALFVMLGHMFPFAFRFRGGKGVLSGGTVVVMLDWRIAAVVLGIFLILAVATKWVSLGSMVAGIAFPIVTWFVFRDSTYTWVAAVIAVLILWKHRENLKRILRGNESKFALRKKEAGR